MKASLEKGEQTSPGKYSVTFSRRSKMSSSNALGVWEWQWSVYETWQQEKPNQLSTGCTEVSQNWTVSIRHYVVWYNCFRTALYNPEHLTKQPGLSLEVRAEPLKRVGWLQEWLNVVIACDREVLCFSSLAFQQYYLWSTKGTNKQGEKFSEAELHEELLDVRPVRHTTLLWGNSC